MYNLIIDTSTDCGFIALAKGASLEAVRYFHTRDESKNLLILLDQLLGSLNLSCESIKAIGLGCGPGSYTGIRIAAAYALGLTAPGSFSLITFSSFEGLISEKDGEFISMIPAKVRGAYLLTRRRLADHIVDLGPFLFVPYSELGAHTQSQAILIAPYTPPVKDLIVKVQKPDLGHLAKIVENKYSRGEFSQIPNLNYSR